MTETTEERPMIDYSDLKRLAEAATPGPWIKTVDGVMPEGEKFGIFGNFGAQNGEANREFIAAADPAAVLAMIAENERLHAMTGITMGVGSGGGSLFVHGDYDSIKAAQAIVLERDKLMAENEALRKDAERYQFIRNRDHEENLHALIMYRNRSANMQCIVGGQQADAVIDRLIKDAGQ